MLVDWSTTICNNPIHGWYLHTQASSRRRFTLKVISRGLFLYVCLPRCLHLHIVCLHGMISLNILATGSALMWASAALWSGHVHLLWVTQHLCVHFFWITRLVMIRVRH